MIIFRVIIVSDLYYEAVSSEKKRRHTVYVYFVFINAVDNVICSQVAEQPDKYLVPHPSDCTKYYSCQNNGRRGGWIAYLMDCPATTGFDKKLRVCNDIKALPRCSKGNRIHQQNQNDGPFML